jgi:hypothetical protein
MAMKTENEVKDTLAKISRKLRLIDQMGRQAKDELTKVELRSEREQLVLKRKALKWVLNWA